MILIQQRQPDQWAVQAYGITVGRIFASPGKPVQFFPASREEAFSLADLTRITRFIRKLERKTLVLA